MSKTEILKAQSGTGTGLEMDRQLRSVLENLALVAIMVDNRGRLSFCNDFFLRLTGWKRSEVLGKDWFGTFVPVEVQDELRRSVFLKTFKTGEFPVHHENEIITKTGERRLIAWNNTALFNAQGEILGLTSIGEDITERRQAEEALKESEARYRHLVQYAPAGIYEFDLQNRRFLSVNDVMCEYTGYSEEEFLELDPYDLLTEDSRAKLNHLLEEVFSGNRNPDPVEYRLRGKNNREFWVLVHANFYFEGGVPKRATAVAHDLTAIRKAQEEKRQLEMQLRRAQKMEAIGTLSGGIAHDFNNILSIILGNSELAIGDIPEWSPARKNLEEVRRACDRAKELIQQILSFSRHTESEMKPIHLAPIVKESLKLLRPSISTGIEIRQHMSARKDTIRADATQVHQVLINLCTNAAHAMEEEGGTLEIELTDQILDGPAASSYPEMEPGPYVELCVRDTGSGMTPEILERIFDPYFTTKDRGKGTGMGLAVVHGIVKSHGGTVSVSSVPGDGTAFHVLFPVVQEEQEPQRPEVPRGEGLPRGHETILFVDDEPAMVSLNQRRLSRLGYRVEVRTDPVEALEWFREHGDQIDLVITDTSMPRLAGDQLARELLRLRPELPILLCTGYSDRIDQEKAGEMGIAGFALKPLDTRQLAEMIRQVLDR